MKYKWLNKKSNKQIIVFFNGWGMDEAVVAHLEAGNFDVIMFYDYNTLETDFDFSTINNYQERFLIAWSMGVMTATNFKINYKSSTAINGTLFPIHDEFGIPKRIYDLTLKGFNEKGAERFIKNMFLTDVNLPVINRTFENQKSELAALTKYTSNEDFKYSKVILGSNDKIIPTKNQSAYWNLEPNITSGHCPFFLYKNWNELL